MMGTNYALPTAQLASVFSLVSFVVWISLGSQSIAAFQHYFANDFSFESNATNKNPDIETGTDIVENSEYADSPEDITLQNLLESPGFRVLPVADTMANNLQNTIQYKIHHWFNLVTFLLLIVKTVGTICCCQFQKKTSNCVVCNHNNHWFHKYDNFYECQSARLFDEFYSLVVRGGMVVSGESNFSRDSCRVFKT